MLKSVVKSMLTVFLEAKTLLPRLGLEKGKIRGELPSVSSAKLRDTESKIAQWIRTDFIVNTVKRGSITRVNGAQCIKRKIIPRIILRIKRT